jgi:hypothetical protein
MTPGAVAFMAASWGLVLGLTFWAFARILRTREHFDPDGIGPASPPVPPAAPQGPPPRDAGERP